MARRHKHSLVLKPGAFGAALSLASGAFGFNGGGSAGLNTGVGVPKKFVGMGQGLKTTVQGFGGGANRSQTVRTRHYSPVAFRKFQVVWQVHSQIGGSLTDTLFANNLSMQTGLEYPYTAANTGISPRVPVTKNGLNYADYDTAMFDTSVGHILSDVIDLGYTIPANTYFGLWNTTELPAGTWSNNLPYNLSASNFFERYIGTGLAATSQIAAKGGASDFALNASSITHTGTTQGGSTSIMTPAFLLIEVDTDTVVVPIIGDSISYSVGEGQAGSSTYGDVLGEARGNAGWIERGLGNVVDAGKKLTWFNLGRGSDGDKNLIDPNNWRYRRKMLALGAGTTGAGVTVINENSKNDNTSPAILTWTATTAYVFGDLVNKNGAGIWICDAPGTSGAVGPSGSGPTFVDGTVTWRNVYTGNGGTQQTLARSLALKAKVNKQIKDLLPTCRLVGNADTPDTTSTDLWATLVNQTIGAGYGTVIDTDRRATRNNWIMTLHPSLLLDAAMQPNLYVEEGFGTTPAGLWKVNGVANYLPQDGKHPNSYGHFLESAAVTVSVIFG